MFREESAAPQRARLRQFALPLAEPAAAAVAAMMMMRLPRRRAPGEPWPVPWLAHFER